MANPDTGTLIARQHPDPAAPLPAAGARACAPPAPRATPDDASMLAAAARRASGRHGGTVIFLHIPKAAGSTLRSLVHRRYAPTELISVYEPRMEDTLRAIDGLDQERKRRARALIGHVSFGIHSLLPNACRYVTVLRDPVRRAVSDYRYILRSPAHPRHSAVRGMSLGEFVAGGGVTSGTVNGQVKYLSRTDWRSEGMAADQEDLRRAKANVEAHFLVAGLAERFDETLWLIARALGWPLPPLYVRENVAPETPPPLDGGTLRLIRQANELDLELYGWAAARFGAAVREAGWRARAGAAALPVMNGGYRAWVGLRHRVTAARRRLGG